MFDCDDTEGDDYDDDELDGDFASTVADCEDEDDDDGGSRWVLYSIVYTVSYSQKSCLIIHQRGLFNPAFNIVRIICDARHRLFAKS